VKEYLNNVRQDITLIQNRLEAKVDEYQAVCQERTIFQTQLKILQDSL
jgi:hypothetical protein